ncbi:hypothetical protein D3C87_1091750 [compost metagenome]
MQESRGQGRRHRHHAAERGEAHHDGNDGHHQNADQHCAAHGKGFEGDDQGKTEGGEDRSRLFQVTEADHGRRVADHDTGVVQGDQCQEQADAGGNRRAQRQRDAVDDPFTDAEDRQQEEAHGRDEYGTQCDLPGVAHVQDHGVGEEGVQAHARCEGDRVVGDQAHGRRADGGGQTGGDEHRALVHAGLAEDARVDEQNVGHGQKGRDARQNLGPHVGVVCLELKQPFQHVCSPWRAGRRECIDLNSKAQAAERA